MYLTINARGIQLLQQKIAAKQEALITSIPRAMQQISDDAISVLQVATPVGSSDGSGIPPGSDAPGRLRDSYQSDITSSDTEASLVIRTTQPTKLGYVVNGRGWVYPVSKKALFWQGLPHPVKSARPSQPNDFITPELPAIIDRAVLRIEAAIKEAMDV